MVAFTLFVIFCIAYDRQEAQILSWKKKNLTSTYGPKVVEHVGSHIEYFFLHQIPDCHKVSLEQFIPVMYVKTGLWGKRKKNGANLEAPIEAYGKPWRT